MLSTGTTAEELDDYCKRRGKETITGIDRLLQERPECERLLCQQKAGYMVERKYQGNESLIHSATAFCRDCAESLCGVDPEIWLGQWQLLVARRFVPDGERPCQGPSCDLQASYEIDCTKGGIKSTFWFCRECANVFTGGVDPESRLERHDKDEKTIAKEIEREGERMSTTQSPIAGMGALVSERMKAFRALNALPPTHVTVSQDFLWGVQLGSNGNMPVAHLFGLVILVGHPAWTVLRIEPAGESEKEKDNAR